jgi:hypothetical protein
MPRRPAASPFASVSIKAAEAASRHTVEIDAPPRRPADPDPVAYVTELQSCAAARLAEAVGVDHVGLGSDMRGLTGATVLPTYISFPLLWWGYGAPRKSFRRKLRASK